MSESAVIAHNLPPQLTPFIGRHDELAEITRLLSDPACRLLTLTGPGGIGKTRLAIEAARTMFAPPLHAMGRGVGGGDAIYFIPLQPLTSPDFIVPTIADAIGFQFYQGSDIKQQLLDFFRDKSMLLVLDNLEHLLDGVHLLSEILAAAPDVRILATSRERLNLLEEWVYEARQLNYPANETETDIEAYDAVQLFVQHARRIQADFALTALQKPAVIRICRLVGGMPLGIELAAAWVRALSCTAIAEEIARSMDILETPMRNVEPRHRTMRAVVEPTWLRLSDNERAVYMKLSVFRGGFTREAAEYVAGATLRILSALVDKSLSRVDAGGRYHLHELLRQYAEEQLEISGEAEATRDCHMNCYADFMSQRQTQIRGHRQLAVLDEIEADFNNIRVAWLRAIQQKNADALTGFLESLRSFCIMRGRFHEGEELFRRAQEQLASESPDQPLIWSRIVTCRGWVQVLGGLAPMHAVRQQLEQALAIARTHDDRAQIALCLWLMGIITYWTNKKNNSARTFFEDALDRYRALGDQAFVGHLLSWIGNFQANMEDTIALTRQALAISREVGDIEMIAWHLNNIGLAKYGANQLPEAAAVFQEALDNHRAVRSAKGIMSTMFLLSQCAFLLGEFDKAAALAEDVFTMATNLNFLPHRKFAFATLGIVSILCAENSRRGKQLCEEVLTPPEINEYRNPLFVMAHLGITISAFTAGDFQTARRQFQAALKTAIVHFDLLFCFPACLAVGALMLAHVGEKWRAVELLGLVFTHPMSAKGWLENWLLLMRLRAQLEADLGSAAYVAAWERGMTCDPYTTVKTLAADFSEDSQAVTTLPYVHPHSLNDRELEVLRLVAAGMSNKEIAAEMMIAVSTVKWYVSEIMSKLHAANRTQAVASARSLGLLT